MKKYQRITFLAIWAVFITLPALAQEKKAQEDQFAKIGNMDVAVRTHLLKENVPAELPEKYLPVSNDKNSAFEPFDLMDTKEELDAELIKMREAYKPFLENYAPSTAQTRDRIYLKNASWRIETDEDQQDFSKALHLEDYQPLFNRVDLSPESPLDRSKLPTDQRLVAYTN